MIIIKNRYLSLSLKKEMKLQSFVFTLVLTLLFLSCTHEPQKVGQVDPNFDQDSFSTYYNESAQKDLDYQERLKLINQAYHLAKEVNIDSLQIKALNKKTILHSLNKQNDSAIYFAKEILNIGTSLNDSVTIAVAFHKLGLYHKKLKDLDSSYFYFDRSKKVYEGLGDSLQVVKNYTNMVAMLSDAGEFAQSDEMAIEALSFLKTIESPSHEATLYNAIAINAKDQNELKDALYWNELASTTTTSDRNRLIYLGNRANIYRENAEYTKAIDIYVNLLDDLKEESNTDNYNRINNNLNFTRWQQTKDVGLEDELTQGLELRKKSGSKIGEIASLGQLTQFYLDWNQSKARIYALDMYQQASKIKHADYQLEALQLLMQAYDNDLQKHNTYAKVYMFTLDSVQQVRAQLSNKFAKIRFDSDKNRQENEILKKTNLQRELELAQSQQKNTMYLALGVISMISFFFIFTVSRSRQQKEKLKEVYRTEARISKKVHDEVANDLYKVMTKLDQDKAQHEPLLDDLEQIYEKTRDISRENNDIDQEQDFGELLSDLLANYSNEQINIITRGLNEMNWSNTDMLTKKTLYRVIQELLTNMKKHSMASVVIFSFAKRQHKILVKYSDDGVGADLKKNNGLLNMENRILNLGGSLTLATDKGKGFKATIIV